MRLHRLNETVPTWITAPDDATYKSALKYLNDITSISVDMASAWESNDREEEAELEQIEKTADREGGDESDETAPAE